MIEVEGVIEDAASIQGSDEDEIEPRFTYATMDGPDAKKLMETQVLTCIAAHVKMIAVGTFSGFIWIMDHMGNVDQQNVPVMRAHRSGVTQIAIDSTGNYVISCGKDGRVVVSGIGTSDLNHVLNLRVTPRNIAISPYFGKDNSFVVCDRNAVLYEKKFFSHKEDILYRGVEKDHFISACSWQNDLIAFTNDGGTRIYDRSYSRIITLVNPTHDVDRVRSSRFPAIHSWLDVNSLAIAWADTVTVLVITVRNDEQGVPRRIGEIHHCWKLSDHIGIFCCGISYVADSVGNWTEIVLFGLQPETEDVDDFCDAQSMVSMESLAFESGSSATPPTVHLFVLSPESLNRFRVMAEDSLKIPTKPSSNPSQFHLAGLPSCEQYFLQSPDCLAAASPCSVIDLVKWKIDKGKLDEAWDLAIERANELEGTEYEAQSVGRQMIKHLLKDGKARAAVARLKEVCGDSRAEWEWAAGVFERNHLSTMLSEVIPLTSPQLEPECYEAILLAALYNDIPLFKKLIHKWNPDLYRTASISNPIIRRMQDREDILSARDENLLMHSIAHLYVYERRFDMAIKLYLSTKDKEIFAVINKYNLFELVKDQITELMDIDTDRALRLLLDNQDSVSAAFVMNKIARQPKLQMAYLTKLLNKNEGAEFADQAVKLYAEHDKSMLMPFLRKNENFHIMKALDICRKMEYIEEMIFLLGKSGNQMEALNLMMTKYNRLDKAIEFCKEHNDSDLWEHLIDLVVKNPTHVSQLLNKAGSSIDPLRVIEKINLTMSIPGLRDSLATVLRDYAARIDLQDGCREATLGDARLLLSTFLSQHAVAVYVGPRTVCSICGIRVSIGDSKGGGDLRLFGCGHSAHSQCCIENERKQLLEQGACAACSESTRDEIAT